MKFDDVVSFTSQMRELARVVPGELDHALLRVGEAVVIPASRERANSVFSGAPPHDGTSVRLADQTKVVATPKGAAIVNKKPYANVQNYGGRTWHAHSRVGRSSKPVGSAIPRTGFITRSVEDDPAFVAAVERELEQLVERHLQ